MSVGSNEHTLNLKIVYMKGKKNAQNFMQAKME